MPYEVIMDAAGCDGHAVVKVGSKTPVDGGCHSTHEDAIAHSQALNLATMNEEASNDGTGAMTAGSDLDATERNHVGLSANQRAVDLAAPTYMRENAARGIRLHEEGLSGSGIVPQTVADARAMARGEVTERKWRKIGPWIARHMVDLEAEGVAEGEITPE